MNRVGWWAIVLLALGAVDLAQLLEVVALRALIVAPLVLVLPGAACLGLAGTGPGSTVAAALSLRIVLSLALLPLAWLSLSAMSLTITKEATIISFNVLVLALLAGHGLQRVVRSRHRLPS